MKVFVYVMLYCLMKPVEKVIDQAFTEADWIRNRLQEGQRAKEAEYAEREAKENRLQSYFKSNVARMKAKRLQE